MNLILFGKEEIGRLIPRSDERCIHIKKILKMGQGDSFDSGIIGGAGGRACLDQLNDEGMIISFTPQWESSPLYPVTLIIGIPRPPTARRLLKDLTAVGVDRLWFTGTDLGEKSYLTSKIWKDEKYMDYVLEGAQQGETTLLPEIRKFYSLDRCLEETEGENLTALDNNESKMSIADYKPGKGRTVIAIGSERGWTERERELLKSKDFTLLSMGSRVLRTETACSMAAGFILAATGHM